MMEKFGKAGHSGFIGIYSDGDGDFRPIFDIDPELLEESKDIIDKNQFISDLMIMRETPTNVFSIKL